MNWDNNDVTEGDVIQVTDCGNWTGCVMIVSQVEDHFIKAYMKVPYKGYTFVRLSYGQFAYIGKSAIQEEGLF